MTKRWITLGFICLTILILGLNNTVLYVALPAIAVDLSANIADLQWIVDAFILVCAAFLLTMGSLGDRFGRKLALQAGLIVFAIGSLLSGLSSSTTMLIASRALTGLGAAIMMPATLSIITATFPDAKERRRAIAMWAASFGLSFGLGPVIGGWLLEHVSWGAVFFINLPLIGAALIGCQIFVPESKDKSAPRPDLAGVLLSIVGLFALVYGIIKAGEDGWGSTLVLASFGVAAVFLTAFVLWERRSATPMLPLAFFKNRSFTAANVSIIFIFFCLFGCTFFLSQYFQSIQGYGAFEAGLRLLPMSAIAMVASLLSARAADRIGTKLTVGIGLLVAAGGLLFLAFVLKADTEYWVALAGICVSGAGFGFAMTPATDSVMGAVPVSKAGIGSALNDTTREVGGALGVAVLGTIMNGVYLVSVAPITDLTSSFYRDLPTGVQVVLRRIMDDTVMDAIRAGIQGAQVVAERLPVRQVGRMIHDTAGAGFVQGMANSLLAAAFVILATAIFAFIALPARVIKPEVEKVEAAEDAEAAPVAQD